MLITDNIDVLIDVF